MAMTDQRFLLDASNHRIPLPIRFSDAASISGSAPRETYALCDEIPHMKFSKSVRIREFKLVKYEAQSIFLDRT
jgi:hypothetical protein